MDSALCIVKIIKADNPKQDIITRQRGLISVIILSSIMMYSVYDRL